MAFPTTPTNGQVTVVNQVSYQYSSATNSWTRILSTANVITANTIAVNGALTVGTTISATGNISVAAGNFFIGNGSQLTGITADAAGFPITPELQTLRHLLTVIFLSLWVEHQTWQFLPQQVNTSLAYSVQVVLLQVVI
jgi:hypothetical protein